MRDDLQALLDTMPAKERDQLSKDYGMLLAEELGDILPIEEIVAGLAYTGRDFGNASLPGIVAYSDERFVHGMSKKPDRFSPRWDDWAWVGQLSEVQFSQRTDGTVRAMLDTDEGVIFLTVGAHGRECADWALNFLKGASTTAKRARFRR